ncbi:hypothetical protein ACFW6V_28370 [Streptomyces sp. NPDC058734]|uniref:hypothetical protein n=1 Tax=Streptomyces sp. NPDC058734 TaxID=3346615 RepID=UPI0036A92DCD
MTVNLIPVDDRSFISARCMLCYVLGPAAALDGPLEPLYEAGRAHLDHAHPGAPLDAIEMEHGRPMGGWDQAEAPHEWMNRVFPTLW